MTTQTRYPHKVARIIFMVWATITTPWYYFMFFVIKDDFWWMKYGCLLLGLCVSTIYADVLFFDKLITKIKERYQ